MGKALAVIRTPGLVKTGRAEYDRAVQVFNTWNDGDKVSPERVKLFFAALKNDEVLTAKGKPYAPATIALFKAGLKRAISLSAISDADRASLDTFFRGIKSPKKTATGLRRDKYLSPEEIQVLIDGSTNRTGAFIAFLFRTGLRISEALALRVSDYKNGMLHIRHGKGDKEGFVRVSPEIMAQVFDAFPGKVYIFENTQGKKFSRRYWFKAISQAGLDALGKHISPHTMRHSIGTYLVERDPRGGLKKAKDLLRHSSIATTAQFYIHSEVTEEDIVALEKEFDLVKAKVRGKEV